MENIKYQQGLSLTKKKLDELTKDYMSKSVKLPDSSENDTEGSTHGSFNSRSHQFMDSFPDMLKKHEKKSPFSSNKKSQSSRRRSSVTEITVYEENPQEEYDFDSEEKQPNNHHTLPHINWQDHKEFSIRMDRYLSDKIGYNQTEIRQRTQSVDKIFLEKVDEDGKEQDEAISPIAKLDMKNLIDQNEFNSANVVRRVSQKKISMNLGGQSQEIIQEDYESEKVPEVKKRKSKFSENNNINSPRYRLKVDELDKEKSAFAFISQDEEDEEVEPIIEEEKEIDQTVGEKKLEHSIEKLHKELKCMTEDNSEPARDCDQYLKQEIESMGQIQELEDSSDDDQNSKEDEENEKKKRKKRASLQ